MKHFVDGLEAALGHAALERRRPAVRTALATSPRRVAVLAASVAAALAVLAVVVGSVSAPEPAFALPVLQRPATDISAQRPALDRLAASDARFRDARAIATPHGRGYVVPAAGGKLCLAVPDVAPGSYGQTCASTARARRAGLVITFVAPEGARTRSFMVAVLPHGAPAPKVREERGGVTEMTVDEHGVASATFAEDAEVELVAGGRTRTVAVPAHEPERSQSADCGGGVIHRVPEGGRYEDACG